MIKKTPIHISATEAAQTFGHLLNRCRYQGAGFLVYRFGKPICVILPADGDDSQQPESLPDREGNADSKF